MTKKMLQNRIFALIAFKALTLFASASPNIVFILADDLGWRDLSSFGSTYYETPHLDALAAKGMKFTNAYAASPLCSPTRASILTGQYPGRLHFTSANGHTAKADASHAPAPESNQNDRARITIPDVVNHVAHSYTTIGESFKEAGYATAYMGKWHAGKAPFLPENNGFDEVIGARGEPGPGGGTFFNLKATNLPGVDPAGTPYSTTGTTDEKTHVTEVLVDYSIDFIQRKSEEKQPYFLHLSLYDVHAPFSAKQADIDYFSKKTDPQGYQKSPTMAAMVKVMDDELGRLFEKINSLPNAEDTLIVFYSDNGGNEYNYTDDNVHPTNNAPLRGGKASAYEGGVRVPAFFVWPNNIEANKVSEELVTSVDLFPTFMNVIGHEMPKDQAVDGKSITNLLKGEKDPERSLFFHFPHDPPIVEDAYAHSSIRKGDWKLYKIIGEGLYNGNSWELYNLKTDIGEQENQYYTSPKIAEELKKELEEYIAQTGSDESKQNKNFASYTWDFNGRSTQAWSANDKAFKLRGGNGTLTANFNAAADTLVLKSVNNLDYDFKRFSGLQFRFKNASAASSLKVGITSFDSPEINDEQELELKIPSDMEEYQTLDISFNDYRNFDSANRLKQITFTFPKGITEGEIDFDYVKLIPGASWFFGKEGSTDGWVADSDIESLSTSEGRLTFKINGTDSSLTLNKTAIIDASRDRLLKIRQVNNTEATEGALYFQPSGGSFKGNSVSYPLKANSSEVQEILVNLSEHPNWKGIISKLRVDPIQSGSISSGSVEIDSISFTKENEYCWDFAIDENSMQWKIQEQGSISSSEIADGSLKLNVTGGDPQIFSPSNLFADTNKYKKVRLLIKNETNARNGTLYFETTENRGFRPKRKMQFDLLPSQSSFQEVIVDLSGQKEWSGEVVRLRIDPVNNSRGSVEIAKIELLPVK